MLGVGPMDPEARSLAPWAQCWDTKEEERLANPEGLEEAGGLEEVNGFEEADGLEESAEARGNHPSTGVASLVPLVHAVWAARNARSPWNGHPSP
mmetsp:Transcript_99911/g.122238  ORF Transcript_99911/g.122238 Transcript_99911/m.122238 type:complete len:95 (-) Transcript_99911:453-737(-)